MLGVLKKLGRTTKLKRFFDLAGSSVMLGAATPILIGVAVGVRMIHGKPILFRQLRPGLNGKIFSMYKFRTMTNAVDDNGQLLPDRDRLTGFGVFLRKTSLDELPELINVLKGEMSLVGPRPLLVEYLERYNTEQARRHEVLPGITGWAQVNGRNALEWEEKFKLDVWYVDNWDMLLDIKILFKTVYEVIACRQTSKPGHATAEVFQGTSEK